MDDARPPALTAKRPSSLARYLLGAYVLLIAYGSVHPFSGWRDLGLGPFAFLDAPLPPYVTAFDLVANFIAYFPLGFLVVAASWPRVRGLRAGLLGSILAFALSLAFEAIQSYLPTRIASNLDVVTNTFGGIAGAATGVAAVPHILLRGGLVAARRRLFSGGRAVDFGLVLIGLWLTTQLYPESLLFGNGDVRTFFTESNSTLYAPEMFMLIEGAVTAANLVGSVLLLRLMARPQAAVWRLALASIGIALVARMLAFGILFRPGSMLSWLTPGASIGLVAGLLTARAAIGLPRRLAVALAATLLMLGVLLVNAAPENPYLVISFALWRRGHFLNFNGLTHVVSALWPFLAVTYLLVVARTVAANERHPS